MARIAPGHSGPARVLSFFLLTGLLILAAQPSGLFKFLQPAARAATVFTVNSTGDGADSNTADNVCDDGTGNCTLRAAIQQANATPGDDTINFSVTGTVSLSTALPDLTTNVTITGPGANLLTVQRSTANGTPNFRTFNIPGHVTVALSGLTISGGNPFSIGGGILSSGTLSLRDVTVSGNSGGGIVNFNGGVINLTSCTVSGNSGDSGAGISNSSGTVNVISSTVSNNSADGGFSSGIENTSGLLRIINSTISGNTNNGGAAGGIMNNIGATATIENSTVSGNSAGAGAGIYNNGTLTLTNVTVSGNTAVTNRNDSGGGILNSGTLNLTNCTVTGNAAAGGGGGIFSGNITNFVNTIVFGNTSTAGAGPDLHGTFNSQDHNLIGNTSGATINGTTTHDITGQDPKLGPLADNGGLTFTHALLAGSPALDAGDNSLAKDAAGNPLTTDQRGAGRFAGAAVDIGAYEFHASVEDVSDRTTFEDTPLPVTFDIGDAGTDIISLSASSDNQTLVPDSGLSVTGGGPVRTLLITPAPNLSGTAHITLTENKSGGGAATDSFLLTVLSVNDAPTFTGGADVTVAEDSGPQTISNWATAISAGPANESGQSLSFAVTADTNPSLFSAAPAVSSSGTLTFTSAPNANGSATVTLVLKDDGGTANGGQDTSASQSFKINVTPVNDPPKANDQSVTTPEDSPKFIFFTASDVDGDTLTFSVVSAPSHGTLSGSGLGRTYTPAHDFNGPDSFTFKATDPSGAESAPATVSINVTAVNDPPFNTVPGPQATDQNAPLVFSAANSNAISVSDVDAGTDPVKVTLTATHGTLTLGSTAGLTFTAGTGTDDAAVTFAAPIATINAALAGLTFKPQAGFSGTAALRITTDDQGSSGAGGALSTFSQVSITVREGTVEFTQSTYSVSEGAGSLAVTVRRTGDTSQAATVDYATDDGSVPSVAVPCSATTGIALDRCDFTKALGRLRFAPGEAEKSFNVLITDDSYVEGTETAQLRLSKPLSATPLVLGSQVSATMEITDNDAAPSSVNPADDTRFFVRQHYHDFLSREPDDSGLQFWTQNIESCGASAGCRAVKRVDTSAAFFLSIEFQETGFLVYKMNKAAFGNLPNKPVPVTLNSFLTDTQRISQGLVVGAPGWEQQLETNKQAFADEFVARAGFTTLYPQSLTPEQYVDSLNANAGGVLSQAERDSLVSDLKSGLKTRAQVLRAVAENPQMTRRESNPAFVLMQYFGYLRRDPDSAPDSNFDGYNFWLSKLNQFGGNFRAAEMVRAFIESLEYRARFGQ